MNQLKRHTATRALWRAVFLLALLCCGSASWAAQVAATVVQLSGPLLARKADGVVKVLSLRSEVESGDTLVTEKNTYAMLRFIDNGEITLKPGTTMKIDKFAYDAGKPAGDEASFNLIKGGLRSVTGLLGKRNKEKFEMKTPSATIGIRGTTFIAEWIEPTAEAVAARDAARDAYLMASTASLDDASPVRPLMLAQAKPPAPASPALPPGLYVSVIDGLIHVTNPVGTQNFSAGQFGYTPNVTTPPVVVPANPGMQFSPPPVFNAPAPLSGAATPAKSNTVDCIVR